MRIIAGSLGGRRIEAPKGRGTRPTTDRVRESLFSTLGSAMGGFEDAVVLDAFAGAGALGLEALSRGAAHVTFVERDRSALSSIKRNVDSLGVGRETRVVQGDVLALAKRNALATSPFSLILLDPPYTLDPTVVWGFLEALAASGGVAAGAFVSYERSRSVDAVWPAEYEVVTSRVYGSTVIDIAVFGEGEGQS